MSSTSLHLLHHNIFQNLEIVMFNVYYVKYNQIENYSQIRHLRRGTNIEMTYWLLEHLVSAVVMIQGACSPLLDTCKNHYCSIILCERFHISFAKGAMQMCWWHTQDRFDKQVCVRYYWWPSWLLSFMEKLSGYLKHHLYINYWIPAGDLWDSTNHKNHWVFHTRIFYKENIRFEIAVVCNNCCWRL